MNVLFMKLFLPISWVAPTQVVNKTVSLPQNVCLYKTDSAQTLTRLDHTPKMAYNFGVKSKIIKNTNCIKT